MGSTFLGCDATEVRELWRRYRELLDEWAARLFAEETIERLVALADAGDLPATYGATYVERFIELVEAFDARTRALDGRPWLAWDVLRELRGVWLPRYQRVADWYATAPVVVVAPPSDALELDAAACTADPSGAVGDTVGDVVGGAAEGAAPLALPVLLAAGVGLAVWLRR